MTEIKITKYDDFDYDNLLQLIIEFQNYMAKTDTKGLCKKFDSKDDAKKYLDQLLKDAREREGAVYLAKESESVVGFIQGVIDRHNDDLLYSLSHKPGDHGWVGELYIKPQYRGRGIATKLMAKIAKYFKEKGCMNIRLYVMADNKLARKAYKKLGFDERDLELGKDL